MSDASSPPEQAEVFREWLHGVAAGLVGALVISVVFLVLDIADGRPLYTPNALGAALFRGQSLAPDAPIEPVLVAGYTAVHGMVFVAFGLMAALSLLEGVRRLGNPLVGAAVTAAVLFAGFEILFEVFGMLFTPAEGRLGGSRAAFANVLAALAMAGYLAVVRGRSAR